MIENLVYKPFLPIKGTNFGVVFAYSLKSSRFLYFFSRIGTPDTNKRRLVINSGLITNQSVDNVVKEIKNIPHQHIDSPK